MGSNQDASSSRRDFIKRSAAGAAGAGLSLGYLATPTAGPALGANDRIRLGFIGVGNRGSQLLAGFMKNPDVQVVALCDAYEPYRLRERTRVDARILAEIPQVPRMGEAFEDKVDRYADFRNLLDRKDIDAVVIATPDHWHSLQMILAVEAGKDVYVEKPLTVTLSEGRRMIDAARKSGRIVQVGLNRRGSKIYQELARLVPEGRIGKVTTARAFHVSNMFPNGIGSQRATDPPAGLDWDMWLGPRAYRPYQYNIAPYKFRWWKDYSSQMGNWGVHYMDAIRWLMREEAPVAVTACGGKYLLKDDRTIPDTMQVTFEMPSGAVILFGIYEAHGGETLPHGEVELSGSKANLFADEGGYRIVPSKAGQFQDWSSLTEAAARTLESPEDSTSHLIRNFLDCVKSRREPWCPLEEGHRSTSFAHLANIALEMKMRLEWDADKERFTNSEEANRRLSYEYRAPWKQG